jgi:hypothetical protein
MTIIPLSDEFAPSILQGNKTSTIRRGHRDYPVGSCIFRTRNRDIPVKIEHVRYCQFHELTDQDAQRDGFRCLHDLQQALDQIYPELKPKEDMTVISFAVSLPNDQD